MSVERMRCVMRHREGREAWAARAEGCAHYGYGATPGEAMAAALFLLAGNPPRARQNLEAPPARRSLFDEDEEPVTRRRIT